MPAVIEVSFSEGFKKAYQKSVGSGTISASVFRHALGLFSANPFDVKLKTHKLSGKLKGLWSFSIGYDVRVVFYFTDDKPQKAIFVNIGNHDDVY